jgi:GNAT superfamily N-acetyltransferase
MSKFEIRKMSRRDLDLAMQWAALEGWNFGLSDPECFFSVDQNGFLMGFSDGLPVGCISVFAYPPDFSFLGLFIVKKDMRGKGFGKKLWSTALERTGKRICALDGILSRVPLYESLGFKSSYAATCAMSKSAKISWLAPEIKKLSSIRFQKICDFDKQYFPADRTQFLDAFVRMPHTQGFAYVSDDAVKGYGAIRPSKNGWKIGPLYAENATVAEALYDALQSCVDEGTPIYANIPGNNAAAVELGRRKEMKPIFQTMRMYLGTEPKFDHSGVFSVTSFEVG